MKDQFEREIHYLRLSVTDKCDLRCSYCIPKQFKDFNEPKSWLSFSEILELLTAFNHLGFTHLRLTGGEPLLRKNLAHLVAQIKQTLSFEKIALTTNGTMLAQHAKLLKDAGLDRVNISLDTLRPDCFTQMTGSHAFNKVILGIETALAVGFENIKINMVPIKGVNDKEIEDMVLFCQSHNLILNLIEVMPMGLTGQNSQGIDLSTYINQLALKFDLVPDTNNQTRIGNGPSRYWVNTQSNIRIGIITPISQHFCATCNRVRVSVDGILYPCLGQNDAFDLKRILRQPHTAMELQQTIEKNVLKKPERHFFNEIPEQIVRIMSKTGG